MAVMPQGVEHKRCRSVPATASAVAMAVMPQGVEHTLDEIARAYLDGGSDGRDAARR